METLNLKVNTNRLASDVQQLTTRLAQAKEHGEKIRAAMDALNAMWEGPARDAEKQRFDTEYANLVSLYDLVQQMIDELSAARDAYETCENQVMDTVSGLRV